MCVCLCERVLCCVSVCVAAYLLGVCVIGCDAVAVDDIHIVESGYNAVGRPIVHQWGKCGRSIHACGGVNVGMLLAQVIGTEHGDVHIVSPQSFSILTTLTVPAPVVAIHTHGSYGACVCRSVCNELQGLCVCLCRCSCCNVCMYLFVSVCVCLRVRAYV